MICSNCQTENPDSAKFCMNCGAALPAACIRCGFHLPAGARFCPNCGHPVEIPVTGFSSAVPVQRADPRWIREQIPQEYATKLEAVRMDRRMEGERRIVTILFCDVSGSTSMAEQLDPEEWTSIMNRAFQVFLEPVYRYEGTIARLMGDAILAFFGAPVAHEDDPQRAVLAALDMIQINQSFRNEIRGEYGLDFNIRIGINTGLVVVGAVGSDLMMEYTAMGDAVNLAARMQQTAEPGTVQITESTYRLISNQFEVQALGKTPVKGKVEPVQAYQVLRFLAGEGPSRGIEGLHSPLVGREPEVKTFENLIEKLNSGEGGILSIIGEAGLGKSRLLAEMRERSSIRWLEGRSYSYETNRPYAPFIDLFTKTLGLNDDQTDTNQYARIRARLLDAAGDQAAQAAPFISVLLGISPTGEDYEKVRYLEPPHLRERIHHAVEIFIEYQAANHPVALVFEDLHWIDQASFDLLAQLASLVDRVDLLLVALFRLQPQELSGRYHEMMSRAYPHRYTAITLQPLDEKQAKTLVGNLLYIEDLPEKVRAMILRKAEGNPFFVEEMIRSLLDAGLVVRENSHWRATRDINTMTVPETLAGVITARLDRLNEDGKAAIQTAALIGREFPFQTLHAILGSPDGLDEIVVELQRREFVLEKARHPDRIFSFKHVLTQETAYESLLVSKRRTLHRRAAELLEAKAGTPPDEIARHWLEAREGGRAFPHLVEAAQRAARAYATQEAIQYYRQALQFLPDVHDIESGRRVYEGMGSAQSFSNQIQAAIDTYQSMYRYGQENQHIPIQVSALNKMSDLVAMRLGQFPEAEKLLLDAEHLARDFGDRGGLAEMYMVRCGLCTAKGDFDTAVTYLSESVQIGQEMGEKEQMSFGLTHIANTQVFMTRFDEAWNTGQAGLRLAEEIGHREHQAELLTFALPMVHWRNGDMEAARTMAEEGVSIAEAIGACYPEAMGGYLLGSLALAGGDYEQAIAWLKKAVKAGQDSGYPFVEAIPLSTLGTVYLEISDKLADKTREYHRRAVGLIEMPGGQLAGASGWVELGWCALRLGELEKAQEYFEKGLTIPSPAMMLQKPGFLLGLASIAVLKGQIEPAEEQLRQAQSAVEASAMRHFDPLVSLVSARIAEANGDLLIALEAYDRAEEAARHMGMLPRAVQANAGAARILEMSGRHDEARLRWTTAQEFVRQMAARFNDIQLRELYLARQGETVPL